MPYCVDKRFREASMIANTNTAAIIEAIPRRRSWAPWVIDSGILRADSEDSSGGAL